jgi:hypothetical protein
MIQRITERLTLLKAERQRRFTELAQYDAVIAELEQLLQPPAAPEPAAPAEEQALDALGKSGPVDEPVLVDEAAFMAP